jgi:hypothetical protein
VCREVTMGPAAVFRFGGNGVRLRGSILGSSAVRKLLGEVGNLCHGSDQLVGGPSQRLGKSRVGVGEIRHCFSIFGSGGCKVCDGVNCAFLLMLIGHRMETSCLGRDVE